MAYVARKIPFVGTPDTNPETKPFFDGAAAGKLMLRRCTSCKKAHWYPRGLCPFCFGECAWEEASGKGKIYTFSIMERASRLRHRLCHARRRAVRADQLRRLRLQGPENRPGRDGEVRQAEGDGPVCRSSHRVEFSVKGLRAPAAYGRCFFGLGYKLIGRTPIALSRGQSLSGQQSIAVT